MDSLDYLLELVGLPFVQRGMLEVAFLSLGAGVLGSWVVLRGLAFFSHAVGMATFPGLVLANGLGFAAPLGALLSSGVFAAALQRLSRIRKSGYDSLTALALVGMLAAGVILASDVFGSGAEVDSLLFGSLLAISSSDVFFVGAVGLMAMLGTLVFGRTWLATGFNPEAARSLGARSVFADATLFALVALLTTAALPAVGSLLSTALIIVPAATTRLWTAGMRRWQLASVLLVAVEGISGLWLSLLTNTPPGATIAMLAGIVFALSLAASGVKHGRRAWF